MNNVGNVMKKIMVFYSGYLPGKNFGGPVVSISNFVNVCGDEFDIYIVTGNHDLKETVPYSGIKNGWNQVGKAKVMYLADSDITYNTIKRIVDEIDPDLIYQNGLFVANFAIPAFRLAKSEKRKVLVSSRGELFGNALKQKAYKKIPFLLFVRSFFINENTLFHATTEEEEDRLRKILGLKKDKIFKLENLPSLPNDIIVKKQKQKGRLMLIYIARIHPIKNLYFALNCLKDIAGEITFNIYGPIEIPEYWEKCKTIIEELPKNIHVNYCGIAEREEVHRIYSAHDVMILPTLTENYGHSIVEAMLSNCPVIISDNTPWTDVNKNSAGWAIALSQPKEYVSVIQRLVEMDDRVYDKLLKNNAQYIENRLKVKELKMQYIEVLNNIIINDKGENT